MRISTEIGSTSRYIGEEEVVRQVALAGFDAFDFSMFDMARFNWETRSVMDTSHPLRTSERLAFARRLKQIAADYGIVCNQSHAPFPSMHPEIRAQLEHAIECTAEAGGSVCVIHPDNNRSAEQNAEMYAELLPFAKSCGVKIATENMWNWDNERGHALPAACSGHADFLAHIEAVNDPFLVACVDIGHAEMRGLGTDAVTMIRTLGSHVQALHIHDNDLLHDSHLLPFNGSIAFGPIVQALKEIRYSGYFTLEADTHCHGLASGDVDAVAVKLREMAAAARKLADMFQQA